MKPVHFFLSTGFKVWYKLLFNAKNHGPHIYYLLKDGALYNNLLHNNYSINRKKKIYNIIIA